MEKLTNHKTYKNINKTQKIKKLEKSLKRQQRKLSCTYEQNKTQKVGEFCTKNRKKQLVKVQKLYARYQRTFVKNMFVLS